MFLLEEGLGIRVRIEEGIDNNRYFVEILREWIRRRVQNQLNGDVEITGIGLSAVESKSIGGVPKDSEMDRKIAIWMWMEKRCFFFYLFHLFFVSGPFYSFLSLHPPRFLEPRRRIEAPMERWS
ncbi:hypothetical protein B9Z55_016102 [Caenorhabditis nigoni]|uniref:Uncharacterized protein n=1 Tax=Caenorhabditis nigoni TaxID=1611254 RepID=A0A2G5UD65_9PELO|nr:hypothetical protein B9Z55_016102 [Caenorhabditis nigoni]